MTAKLDFIIGRAGTGKTHACLQAMQQEMTARPLGPALILLLPEHMTYKTERELATMMEKTGQGFFRAYVFGFRRFARQILLETGGDLPRIFPCGQHACRPRTYQETIPPSNVPLPHYPRRGGTEKIPSLLGISYQELWGTMHWKTVVGGLSEVYRTGT